MVGEVSGQHDDSNVDGWKWMWMNDVAGGWMGKNDGCDSGPG